MPESAPAIELRNVVKSFGQFRAIDTVSLTVESGIFITLLGPSGCGKSTLLRSIAGFLTPDSGSIMVGGRDVTSLPPHIRPVNMVFQDYALFPHMSVRRNIGFGCEMKGMALPEIEARVDAMLELIRLPDLGHREPGELSGGQRQRVALARAMAPDPVSLLLDEPLGALDLKLRLELQHELKSIQRATGKTFVFVTHDQDEAMSMSDLVAVMKDGRIEQLDTPRTIYARPATAFVAGFVGAANMLPARVAGIDGAMLALEVEGRHWTVPAGCVTGGRTAAPGDAVTLVVRPEDVIVGPGSGLGELGLPARAREQTFLGGRVHLRCETSNGTTLTLEVRPGSAPDGDGQLDLHIAPDAVAVLVDKKETAR